MLPQATSVLFHSLETFSRPSSFLRTWSRVFSRYRPVAWIGIEPFFSTTHIPVSSSLWYMLIRPPSMGGSCLWMTLEMRLRGALGSPL